MTTDGLFSAWSGHGLNDRFQWAPNAAPTSLYRADSNVISLETVALDEPPRHHGSNNNHPGERTGRATLLRR